jgi:phosphohistidine swiveling domain-containing protein
MSFLLKLWHTGIWKLASGELTFRALRDFYGLIPGCNKSICISVGSRGHFRVYLLSEELERSQKDGYNILTNEMQMKAFLSESEQIAQMVEQVAREVEKTTTLTSKVSNLADAFERSNEVLTKLYAYYHLSNEEFSRFVSSSIRQFFAHRVFDYNDILNCLTSGDTKSLKSFQEMQSWLDILQAFHERGQDIEGLHRKIFDHIAQYSFLAFSANNQSNPTLNEYLKQLLSTQPEDIIKLRLRLENIQRRASICEETAWICAQRLGLSMELFQACRSIAHLSISRLRLREASQFHYQARELLMLKIYNFIDDIMGTSVCKALKRQLTIQEIHEILRAGILPSLSSLENRFEKSITQLKDRCIQVTEGESIEKHLIYWQLVDREQHLSSCLQGTVVFGENTLISTALVLSVYNTSHKDEIFDTTPKDKESYTGQIIVTHMISPQIIPLCINVTAIVTEEGGLTSHAAVLARELGIPCVVGVIGATQAFKTGEWLEISFSTGCIQKVSATQVAQLSSERITKPSFKCLEYKSIAPEKLENLPLTAPVVVELKSPEAAYSLLVGGKAANLHRIHNWTPPGFVITTAGIRRYLLSESRTTPSSSSNKEKENLVSINSPIVTPQSPLQKMVENHLKSIGHGSVAVRSSDYNEDSESKSYAGLFESFTDIDSSDSEVFWQAVSDVVASALDKSVTQYKEILGSSGGENTMAVLVQRMVQPLVSGVALTSIRRSERDWLLVEYNYGPLAPLVSGIVSPKRSAMLRSIFLQTSRTSEFVSFLMPPGLEAALGIDVVNQLGSRIADVEALFGEPLEIEWAVDSDGSIWILQARPITVKP